ncbi:MAG: hypothetical protein QOG21_16 [Actinomycetota bacterium]|jgi:hypothetical protein|nr:hypothetical protein [Actinomycetota bacterium]
MVRDWFRFTALLYPFPPPSVSTPVSGLGGVIAGSRRWLVAMEGLVSLTITRRAVSRIAAHPRTKS